MAKSTTWTGAADTTWSNAANWSNGVPADGDTVTFAASIAPTTGPDDYIGYDSLDTSGLTDDLSQGVTYNITIFTSLILGASGSSVVHAFAGYTISGTATVNANSVLLGYLDSTIIDLWDNAGIGNGTSVTNCAVYANSSGNYINGNNWFNTSFELANGATMYDDSGNSVVNTNPNLPSESNVHAGATYGYSFSQLTGTLAASAPRSPSLRPPGFF